MQQYQVSELTDSLKKLMGEAFPGLIMVTGEVSESFKSSNGHFYFSLKDEGAKLKAVYFRQHMRPDSFVPKNGDEVKCVGEMRLYPPDGTYQLLVRKIVYSAGGEFWKRFEETKAKLESEGLFNEDRKRPIPDFPRRIALLTAETGAAVRDFVVTAKKAGLYFNIDLWPIPVQGEETAPVIAKTISRIGSRTDRYDALVLTRGGGSLDDLAVFNEESVARALASSLVPTISAIGHERDTTICDFVCDERVATPTAAAERLCRAQVQAALNVENLKKRVSTLLLWRWENVNLGFDTLISRLHSQGADKLLQKERYRLHSMRSLLYSELQTYATKRKTYLQQMTDRFSMGNPTGDIRNFRHRLELLQSWIQKQTSDGIFEQKHRLALIQNCLELTDPERLLSLGYALVLKNGHIVAEAKEVSLEEELEIKMKDGYINTFVTGKKV